MKEVVSQWLDSALMDLRNIEKILDDNFLTPIACFHAQQCVEKSMKAVLESCGNDIPKTHDLFRLHELIIKQIDLYIDLDLLQIISDLYIETRYPGDFGLLPDGKPTIEDVKTFYQFAKQLYETIQDVLIQREKDNP